MDERTPPNKNNNNNTKVSINDVGDEIDIGDIDDEYISYTIPSEIIH